jgi:hypothetical protein
VKRQKTEKQKEKRRKRKQKKEMEKEGYTNNIKKQHQSSH